MLNSWFFEASAMIFSAVCLLTVAVMLCVYDGKAQPKMPYGITLNAIVSILATSSKSGLLCAVAGAIGQLKWCWFKEDRKLQDLQSFDEASRGPGGSTTFLLLGRPSLASIGALITILALVFDPFVQQVIQYPSNTRIHRNPSAVTGKASTFHANPFGVGFLGGLNMGLWSSASQFRRIPTCPSGSCHWPVFFTVEWCSKCVDATSYATIEGICDPNDMIRSNSSECKVSFGHRKKKSFLRYHRNRIHEPFTGAKEVVWEVNSTSLAAVRLPSAAFPLAPDFHFLDVRTPLLTLGYASLSPFSANASVSLRDQELSKPKLHRAEECILTPCMRDYQVKVQDGVPRANVVSTNYGLIQYTNFDEYHSGVCWQPDRENITYSSVPGCEGVKVYPDCPLWTNTTRHAFCDVDIYLREFQRLLTGSSLQKTYDEPSGALSPESSNATFTGWTSRADRDDPP